VHFPTDLNLLWDSLRKCLDTVEDLCEQDKNIKSWRKIKFIRKEVKRQFRNTSQQVFKGRIESAKQASVKTYLQLALELHDRFKKVVSPVASPLTLESLAHYNAYVKTFIGQIERRLLKGETIPSEEKIFSIFEPHTEWITKGKMRPSVELGHGLLLTTCQHHFIVDYKVMEKQKDVSQVEDLQDRLTKLYPETTIHSHSFDKGFYSKDNYNLLKESGIKNVILPKKGKLNKEEKERESTKEFRSLRNAHSGIESNINMLEHHGLNRCPDKGLHGYKRYVGLSVLAYNLHILGNHIVTEQKEKAKKKMARETYRYKKAA
jgi:hypothetical protein